MSRSFIFVVAAESLVHHLGYLERVALAQQLREASGLDDVFMRRRMITLSPRLYGAIGLLSLLKDGEERAEAIAFLEAEAPEIMIYAMVVYNGVERLSDWEGDGACLTVQKEPFEPGGLECFVQPVYADPEKTWRFSPPSAI